MNPNFAKLALLLPLLAVLPSPALAHGGAAHVHGLAAGAAHPFTGADHLLAMLAVGLWAAQLGGRARWALPAAFTGVLAAGAALGAAGLRPPGAEFFLGATVLGLGLLVALAARWRPAAAAALVGAFALVHGAAHGAAWPAGAAAAAHGAGFVLATLALHGLGLLAGLGLARTARGGWVRAAGAAIAAAALARAMA
jgi:urease accessory protein